MTIPVAEVESAFVYFAIGPAVKFESVLVFVNLSSDKEFRRNMTSSSLGRS